MNRKTFAIIGIAVLLASMLGTAAPGSGERARRIIIADSASAELSSPSACSASLSGPSTTVRRTSNRSKRSWKKQGIPLAGPEARAKAVQAFRREWAERNPTTPDPRS